MMNQLFSNSLLFGGNAPFVEELYENYLNDPTAVPPEWREYFDKLAQLPGAVARDVPHLPVVSAFAEQARIDKCRDGLAVLARSYGFLVNVDVHCARERERNDERRRSEVCELDERVHPALEVPVPA